MKPPRVKINFCSYGEIANKYPLTGDPFLITHDLDIPPMSLSGKLIAQLSKKDEVEFLTKNLSTISIRDTFMTMSVRLHNVLVHFVNYKNIKPELIMFDTTSDSALGSTSPIGHQFVHFENGWGIQTRREDVYVELCTRLVKTSIPVPLKERIRNWVTRKGSTSKDIPALKYTVVLKVFDTPASFYYINLLNFDVDIHYLETAYYDSNWDFFLDQEPITSKTKERCDARKVYFRQG